MSEATHSPAKTGVLPVVQGEQDDLFRDVVDALPVPTVVLDRAGLLVSANRAFSDLVQQPGERLTAEPFLGWLSRASEREGFGRAFMGLRERHRGGFVLELGILPKYGPPVDCVVRANRLQDGHVVLTCQTASESVRSTEAELGLAVTRSLDALDQGVLLIDAEGKVVHTNPAAVSLVGGRIVGRSVLELAGRATVPILSRALTVARSGGWHGELVLRRIDGESLPVDAAISGGSAPAVMLLRDLREQRRRDFEERLIGQVDRRLVATPDPRLSVMAACSALAGGLAAGAAVVLVKTGEAWERWTLTGDEPEPAQTLTAECSPPASWEVSREVEAADPRDEQVMRCFGGLQGFASAARLVLRAPSGVVGHLLLAHREVDPWDARDRALMAVVASQIALGLASGLLTLETRALAAYQSMVLDQTSVLLDSVDEEGRVVTWNRASEQLLDVPHDEAVGKRFGVEVGEARDPGQWDDLWATLQRDGVVAREITLKARGGDEIPLHLEGRVLKDDDEDEPMRGAVFVGLDLRDRRALENQILRSQKLAAVGLLAAGIAHEINNPLSGVVGYSKLLLEKSLPDPIRDKVQKIAASGERCRKIVEGVLLFSRQQEGGVRRKIDLLALLDRVISIGEYQWRMHNVRILREQVESVHIVADADQLEQVVLNLLSNAVDAMPRGGTIRVALRAEDDGWAALEVGDEGHGIPEEIQARIFDPFFSTKEIGKGTGLGLAISYGIVQDHGGDIVVESSPGQGARFIVRLPPAGVGEEPSTP